MTKPNKELVLYRLQRARETNMIFQNTKFKMRLPWPASQASQ